MPPDMAIMQFYHKFWTGLSELCLMGAASLPLPLVENNNKFIRRKKKLREEIERWVLSRYQMKKPRPDGCEYELSIPYETDKDLDEAIYDDILYEANSIAEDRYCFIEANITAADDPDRSWW